MKMGIQPGIKRLPSPLNEMKGRVTERERQRVVWKDGGKMGEGTVHEW